MSNFLEAIREPLGRRRDGFPDSLLTYAASRLSLLWLLVCALGLTAARGKAEEPTAWAKAHLPHLVQLYRHLHQNPELSHQEKQTSARLAQELQAAGAEVTTGVGGTGVVALVRNGGGPTIMVRTDMDALPVTENTGVPYASTVKVEEGDGSHVGVMHACGHDIHMASLVGVTQYLAANKPHWSGTLMLVCQPAEERGSGAEAMLKDGLFGKFPKPDFALALHVDSTLPTGQVGYKAGYTHANVDSVDITVRGRGGHGAYPHMTVDPVVVAAKLIVDLQTIVSREIEPTQPAVVTVGSIRGGSKHNIIGDTCHLQLTVRSYSDEVRRHLLEAIERKAKAAALAARAPAPEVKLSEATPAVFNDEALVRRALPSLKKSVGDGNAIPSEPSMGGEDFSEYGRAGVPIFMFRLGAVDAARLESYKRRGETPPSLHSAVFYPDAEPTLRTGVVVMTTLVMDLAPHGEK